MKMRWYFLAAVLLLAGLACNFTGISRQAPASPIPVTTQAVETLQRNVQSAAEQAQSSGEINLTIDETQLTSMVALELQKQPQPILENPQVYLRNGQVQLRGDVHQGSLTAPLEMDMTVTADDQGKPHYQVVSAKLGPLPLPQSILDQLTAQIDRAFADQLGSQVDQIYINRIDIADGKMTVQGRARQ